MKVRSKKVTLLVLMFVFLLGGAASGSVAAGSQIDQSQQVQFSTPIMIVNTSFLNIRTGPGVRYSVLITVVGGTELPVLGAANDGVWYQVSTVVGVGWVNSEYVLPRGDFTNVPTVSAPPFSAFGTGTTTSNTPAIIMLPGADQGGGGAAQSSGSGPLDAGVDANGNAIIVSGPDERFRAMINVEAVDLRDAPNGSPIVTLFRNDSVDYPIVGSSKDENGIEWLAITTPNGTGWVEAPKIRIRLSAACRTVLSVVATTVGLGDSGYVLTAGDEAFLVNFGPDSSTLLIELSGGETGLVPFNSVVTRTGTTTDNLDLDCDAAVTPGQLGDADQGGGGNVPSAPRLAGSRVIVNTAFLNIRSGPSASYVPVATVPGGTELAVLGIASDQVWFLVEGPFGKGWVNQEYTIFRGVIDNVPIIQLSSVTGTLATPQAVISGTITLYAAPGTNFGAVGSITGPLELAVVARTADFNWVQVNSSLGYGWVPASQVTLKGDTGLIPIVG
ncbi:MAG: SH3 domain-containing protein [Anaerolineae bacterium]|nr:SH3 domain-containing protein [Anaerolineae bacterium]